MWTRLRNVWHRLVTSLWFVPSLMAALSLALAALVQTIDSRLDPDPAEVPLLFRGTAEGAGSALAALAGSMIGVTGVVFSITVVALSLASSQLGPRLLRNFMRDRSNQLVLGTFIGTFLFCLVGLQAVNRDLGPAGVPRVTVSIAFALAILSLGVLIYFIHHITVSMQADTVIANVADEIVRSIDHLFPHRVGLPARDEEPPGPPGGRARTIQAPRSGYIQAIDADRLMALAVREDVVLALERRPGQFVRKGSPLARAWPAGRVSDELTVAVGRTFILGRQRTSEQDIEFLVDQLVEVACKALSPGINDPFTALACVDRLEDVLARLAVKEFPARMRKDETGAVRVLADAVRFDALVAASFDPIRRYARGSVSVTLGLLEALEGIARELDAGSPRQQAVIEQAHRVHRTSLLQEHEAADRAAIDAALDLVLAARGGAEA